MTCERSDKLGPLCLDPEPWEVPKHDPRYPVVYNLPPLTRHKSTAAISDVYGYCPQCGGVGYRRERRPNGNDMCVNGHTYPAATAIDREAAQKLLPEFLRDKVLIPGGTKIAFCEGEPPVAGRGVQFDVGCAVKVARLPNNELPSIAGRSGYVTQVFSPKLRVVQLDGFGQRTIHVDHLRLN